MTATQTNRAAGDESARRASSQIHMLGADAEDRWDEFVTAADDGTFYHLAAWRALIENQLGHRTHYLYSTRDGEIDGVLPLVHVKSLLFGNALISSPFLVYGGPIARTDIVRNELAGAARQLAEELQVDYLEMRNRRPLAGEWIEATGNVTFRKPISQDPEENLREVPRKQRAMIRKGIQAGLRFEVDSDASRLYRCLLECKRNLGTPFFGRTWLQAIKDSFAKSAEILTILRDDDVVCSVMSFRFRDEVLPYYGGGGALARQLKGNDYMYWAVMNKAAEEGVQFYDYGRSQVGSGAFRFKQHWGFAPEPLFYQFHLVRKQSLPTLKPTNPRFALAVRAWQRLPLAVANVVGPPIAKRLG